MSWPTKPLRPPETRRCVQSSRSSLNATWRRLAAALNSTVLWSAVQRAATPCPSIGVKKSQLTPRASSHTYRINPAVIDYRPASGNTHHVVSHNTPANDRSRRRIAQRVHIQRVQGHDPNLGRERSAHWTRTACVLPQLGACK